jgi:class 3 adenylate cyclase/tetratricopeptide (TPR) repeat protein
VELTPYVPRLLVDWLETAPDTNEKEVEGSLVFIDLSGFTAMSERLSRKGKVGAEEVTDAINATFSDLLGVSYQVGGSLLKFGGDALLLFFEGENHEARACHAAAGMRSALRERGPIATSAGNITLRMSAGVNSGVFQFFLVGDVHRELVVTGPEVTWTVLMEQNADAGEILISPSVFGALDESSLGAKKGAGRLLRRAPIVEVAPAAISPIESAADLSTFIPTAIRRHLAGGGEEAEHRPVTVAFLHFGGVDEDLVSSDLTVVGGRLHDLVCAVQQACERYEVSFLTTDVDADGGKIILTAGAPQVFENDEERMLRALREIADREYGVELKIGVHRGHVFAGSVGPSYRRTYTIMGDAVNTAARVMSKAKTGQVLATNGVIDRLETLYESEELEPFKVKGKAKELVAYSLGKPLGRREVTVVSDLPLIGREEELGQLVGAVDSAIRREGRVVEVIAGAGFGKSRLLQELVSRRPEVPVLTAQCEQYEISTPYFPFRGLLRAAIGASQNDSADEVSMKLRRTVEDKAPDLSPWLPLIGLTMNLELPMTPEVEQLDERFQRARLADAVIRLLEALLRDSTLLIFEDAHWMDAPSRDLVAALAKRLETQPWAVVVTTRTGLPELASVAAASELCLDPLPESESVELAKLASEHSLLPQQAERVAERSGGNPLFVQALVAAARGTTDLSQLPDSIESAIAARIDELKPGDRTILRHMAVIGRQLDAQLLTQVVEETQARDLEAVLGRLKGFVQAADGKITFRQALIRDAAYEGLSYKRRRAIHEKIGTIIERTSPDLEEQAEILAVHFDQAERFDKSWDYSRLAITRSWRKFAPANAIDFSQKAIRAGSRTSKPGEEMALMWRELGVGFYRSGQYAEASKACGSVRRLTDDVGLIGWLFYMQGRCQDVVGNRTQAVRWYRRGLNLIESQAPLGEKEEPHTSPPPDYLPLPPRVRLVASLANLRLEQGQLKEAVQLSHQAVAVAGGIDDRRGLAIAYNLLLLAYTGLRDPARRKYGELALTTAEQVGNRWLEAVVLNNLAIDSYWEGDWKRSLTLYERSRDSFIASGDLIQAATVASNIAEILSDQGKLDEAKALCLDALGTFRAARIQLHVATVISNLGRAAARASDFDEADRLLAEAVAMFKKAGYPSVEGEARQVEVMIFRGESEKAREALDRIQPGNDPILRSTLHRLMGLALLQAGKVDEAAQSLTTSLQLARAAGSGFEVALSLKALAATAESDEAAEASRSEAKEIFERLGVVSVPEVPLPERNPSPS